ncbi:putative ribosome biogenesis ATPase nvl [Thelohanellus kitauei]|uniref:Putative ribosome biogenesis ATPase nvl n=1 Tax=Thelohanellus kitauei TaxID=669202 RepID=A0A0C2N9C7_THEKT|nr:putative ribosome biogenesis ATPase nvl [Thelohanellus kitauei]
MKVHDVGVLRSQTSDQSKSIIEPPSLVPNINFSNLAISNDNLASIRRVMSYLNHNHLFKNTIIGPCIGAIVTGFPGSGKTTVVTAIAGEYNLPLIRRSAIDLLTDFRQTSDEKVKSLFTEIHVSRLLTEIRKCYVTD